MYRAEQKRDAVAARHFPQEMFLRPAGSPAWLATVRQNRANADNGGNNLAIFIGSAHPCGTGFGEEIGRR